MGIFDGCLLACDIDGTLLYDEILPERNIEKIKDFVREGGKFSLSTGRTSLALKDITSKIDCISPSVLSNGCVIYDFKAKKCITEKLLPRKTLFMVNRVIESVKIGVELHTADSVLVPSSSPASELHERYESMVPRYVSASEAVNRDINKVIYFLENEEQTKTVSGISKDYENECVFYKTSAFIGGVKQNYFEQIPKGVSKASALNELLAILKIRNGGFFAIGDYYNDVEMIKAADIGAVPLESPEDIKAQAEVVTGSVKDGAVADFIEYLEGIFKNGQANKTKS